MMFFETEHPVLLAKEIFWLAWQACSYPVGMGIFQDNNFATKDDVWNNIVNAGDYPINHHKPDKPYADYVFGRMMKFGLTIKKNGIEIIDKEVRSDYQSWYKVYPTIKVLVDKAVNNVEAIPF